jgi:hypothetical protein
MVRFTASRRLALAARSDVTLELSASALKLPPRELDAPAELRIRG